MEERTATWNEIIRLVQSATEQAIVRVDLPLPDEEDDIEIVDEIYTAEDTELFRR